MRFSAAEVAAAVGGQLIGVDEGVGPVVDGVSIDSRTSRPSDLFVPVVAERDGHDFVGAAIDAGVPLYLSSRGPVDARVARIDVDDTSRALMQLGAVARDRITGQVVGITGSVGKTSVKDLTAAALASSRLVHANPASFNNELGLPLTLCNAPDAVEVAVLEMGSRGRGHIQTLCVPARPTVGVVTRVSAAHTELFGSVDAVADAKAELVEALPSGGTAVLNADDDRVLAMRYRTSASILTFGSTEGDVVTGPVELDALLRPSFTIRTPNGSAAVELPVSGAHMALNAAAAIAAGIACGADLDDLVDGLASATLSPMRMELSTSSGGALVINDAYNANPASVRAALSALGGLPHRRRIAVLGVMAELGPEDADAHLEVGREALEAGVEVIAVDAPAYGDDVVHVDSPAAAADVLGSLGDDAAVLIKGSRVAELERLVPLLR